MQNISAHALGIGNSPFPQSFDGSSVLFGTALFVLILITALSIMVGRSFVGRLWEDRHEGKTVAWAYRLLVTSVCAAAVIRCGPEVSYMIAYAEASPDTLQTILTIKRICDVVAIVPVLTWMGLAHLYSVDIEFAIKFPAGKLWSDHRIHRLKHFALIFGCAAGLALAITIGRLFH